MPNVNTYLQHADSQLQAYQDRPVHQLRYSGAGHLQEVLDQVCDVYLPVWSQHGDDLVRALCGRGVELGEHLHQGALVLEGAASVQPPIILFIVPITVTGAP